MEFKKYETVEEFVEDNKKLILEKDGKIVCQTVSTRKLSKGKSVSGVYTPKEERGNGYERKVDISDFEFYN